MKALASRVRRIPPSGIRKYFNLNRDEVVFLNTGTIDFDTFEHIHQAGIRAIEEDFTGYTANSGILPLREAIVEKLARENGVQYDVDEILVTSGSSEALGSITLAVTEPGDEAIIFDPFYPAFGPLVQLSNGEPVYVGTCGENNWNPDPAEVEKAITPRTKLMFLLSPSNPTGAVLSEATTKALCEIAIDHDLYVASDELYEKIVFDGQKAVSPAALPGMRERTFTVSGFSKGFGMTGWRVGYVACPRAMIGDLVKAQQYSSICAPSISQRAALAALTGPSEPLKRMLAELDRRRSFVVDALNAIEGLRCKPQDGTFYTFVDARQFLREKGDAMREMLRSASNYRMPESESEQLTDFLVLRGRVALTHGSAFGRCGEGWFRISEADRMEKLERGLARVKDAMKSI